MRDCHFEFVKAQQQTQTALLVTFRMIRDMENHVMKLKMFRQETSSPAKSHPVAAVHGSYARLALVSFFSLGTRHAWHPWQPLGTVLTAALLSYRTHTHTETRILKHTVFMAKTGKAKRKESH